MVNNQSDRSTNSADDSPVVDVRINKFIASKLGVSRREADKIIASGKVTVGGKMAVLGERVNPETDTVVVDNQPVSNDVQEKILLAFNKPEGVTVTRHDPHAAQTPYDFLPTSLHHVKPIGRLDKDSTGLLLLTNDGDLADNLMHPSHGHDKEYEVTIKWPNEFSSRKVGKIIEMLTTQIVDRTAQSQPIAITNHTFNPTYAQSQAHVILLEGKNREIRRVFEAVGGSVAKLHRIRIGQYMLGNLKPGQYRFLKLSHDINSQTTP